MLSRLLGFARDIILAHLFGAGEMADAFFVAFRIPNLFRRLFGEGAFSQSFVPVLGEYRAQRTTEETQAFVADISGWLALTLAVVTLIGILAASAVVYVIAPGFAANPGKFQLTVELLRITFPYLFLISLVALAGGVLNTHGHFYGACFYAGFPESQHYCHRIILGTASCPTGHRRSLGCVDWWRGAASVSVSSPEKTRIFALAAPAPP
jgi:Uncharacterized membrane protein, putative virulence factor